MRGRDCRNGRLDGPLRGEHCSQSFHLSLKRLLLIGSDSQKPGKRALDHVNGTFSCPFGIFGCLNTADEITDLQVSGVSGLNAIEKGCNRIFQNNAPVIRWKYRTQFNERTPIDSVGA